MAAVAIVTAIVTAVAACGGSETEGVKTTPTAIPKMPKSPVTLNILDVAGDLQLTQGMIDDFKANNPDIVSSVTTSSASAPELVGKIKAQQNAGRLTIDMVLTGTDGLSAGIRRSSGSKLLPSLRASFPGLHAELPAGGGQDAGPGGGLRRGRLLPPRAR